MNHPVESTRRYRLSPRDRTGWVFGLTGTQCLLLGGGVLISGVFLDAHLPLFFVVIPLLVAIVVTFARLDFRHFWDDMGVKSTS